MNSSHDNRCSHLLGSPIRKSPDHRMFASPRGLSQLTTSFFACLCLGIPTYALSSLTIKSIRLHRCHRHPAASAARQRLVTRLPPYIVFTAASSNFCGCPSIFSCQRSRFLTQKVRSISFQNFSSERLLQTSFPGRLLLQPAPGFSYFRLLLLQAFLHLDGGPG